MVDKEWIWPSESIRRVFASYQRGANTHAILISGQYGTGKRTLAGILANTLLCIDYTENKPCGECGPCLRFVSGSHTDVHYIRRNDNKSRTIAVDQIRALLSTLGMRSYEGGATAVIIENADNMQVQAQNALLKSLEEPRGDTFFLLTAEHKHELLPTIRSRCVCLAMPPLSMDNVAKVLENRGIDKQLAQESALYANGSVGLAERYAETSGGYARSVKETLTGMRSVLDVPSAAKRILDLSSKKENADSDIDLYDILTITINAGLSDRAKLGMLDRIQDSRRRDSLFMPKQQTMEDLLSNFLEVQKTEGCRL